MSYHAAQGGASAKGGHRLLWGLAVPFVLLNPLLLLMHGYVWVTSGGTSSASLVYAMKFAPLIYLLVAVSTLGVRSCFALLQSKLALLMVAVFAISLATPFLFGTGASTFYYFADALGLAAVFSYFLLTRELLRLSPRFRTTVFQIMVAGAVVTSLVILGLFAWSGGSKVSIPPDIHYGIALGLTLYFTSGAQKFHVPWQPLVLAAGVGASQFRMNMLVAGLSMAAGWFWALRGRGAAWRALEILVILAAVVVLFAQPIQATLSRFGLVTWGIGDAVEIIRGGEGQILGALPDKELEGSAVDQRYVESVLVWDELVDQPLSLLLGKGFGATFENTGALTGHGVREHSIHNSIFALWLRNGALGVILFLLPGLLALWTLFKRDRGLYVSSAGLLAIYLACMADQYVYWGGYLGIALAVWLHSWRAQQGREDQAPVEADA